MYPWWGKQFRTKRSLPFLVSCLIGLKSSSLLISSFALDHRGISTTMFKIVLLSSAKRGMSCQEETGFPAWFSSQTRQSTIQVKEEWDEPRKSCFLSSFEIYSPRVLAAPTCLVLNSLIADCEIWRTCCDRRRTADIQLQKKGRKKRMKPEDRI